MGIVILFRWIIKRNQNHPNLIRTPCYLYYYCFELYLKIDFVTLHKALLNMEEKSWTCLLKPYCLSCVGNNGIDFLFLLYGVADLNTGISRLSAEIN